MLLRVISLYKELMRRTYGRTRYERLRDARSICPRQLRWFVKDLLFRHRDEFRVCALLRQKMSASVGFLRANE
jgi:hypothetical protein